MRFKGIMETAFLAFMWLGVGVVGYALATEPNFVTVASFVFSAGVACIVTYDVLTTPTNKQ